MSNLFYEAAHRWGRAIAEYGRWVSARERVKWEGLENVPNEPTIWFSWHGTNLIALALHHFVAPRPTQAFMPPGIVGAVARGWLEGAGFEPVLLPKDGTGNPQAALKSVARGLSRGGDVVIAADGPHGPARRVRPGAAWLACLTGRPLMTVGIAATPAVRYPRWDRHLIPLPGARLAVVIGEPIRLERSREIDQPLLDSIGERIDSLVKRARQIV